MDMRLSVRLPGKAPKLARTRNPNDLHAPQVIHKLGGKIGAQDLDVVVAVNHHLAGRLGEAAVVTFGKPLRIANAQNFMGHIVQQFLEISLDTRKP